MKIFALNSTIKNTKNTQNSKKCQPIQRMNFKSKSDIFCCDEKNEYNTFSKLASKKSPKVAQRYTQLLANKELNLTPFEAFIYSIKHNLPDILLYNKNDEYYDSEYFDEEHRETALNYAHLCSRGNMLSDEDIKKCNQFKKDCLNGRFNGAKCLKFIALINGYSPLKAALSESEAKYFVKQLSDLDEISHYINFIQRNPHLKRILKEESNKGAIFKIERIQETDDYQIVSQVNQKTQDMQVQNFTVITSEGIIEKSKTVIQDGKMISYKDSPKIVNITNSINDTEDSENIDETLDICLDKKQSAYQIIHTYQTPLLASAYETIIHPIYEHLGEIDFETAQEICTNDFGYPVSEVKEYEDGSVEYEQFYSNNNVKFESYYYQNKNNSENIYTIRIEDKGEEILNFNRSFEIIDYNTTVTTVNGKQYICKFNDKTVTIIENEKETILNIDDYFSMNERKSQIEFIKTIPADILLKIPKTKCKIKLLNDIRGGFLVHKSHEIYSEANLSILSHEIGHAIDYYSEDKQNKIRTNISQDPKLKEIYNEELSNYQSIFPYKTQNMAINYFSKTGITTSENMKILNTGLSEIVAESQSMLVSFAVIDEATQFRSNALAKYFPKTIAYSAKKLLERTKD
ncbi:hypothetical protein IJ425_01235 [bacterium]|nr:hypothetical protein [bacterium]